MSSDVELRVYFGATTDDMLLKLTSANKEVNESPLLMFRGVYSGENCICMTPHTVKLFFFLVFCHPIIYIGIFEALYEVRSA